MNETPQHAKFWDRVGAYLLDGIIIGFLSFGMNYLNIAYFKSFWIYLLVAVIGLMYKPYFESKYNATLGKLVLNLQVTDWNYNYISFKRALLRSLILILSSLIYIPIHYLAFNNSYMMEATGVFDFSTRLSEVYPLMTLSASMISWIVLADIIVYLVEVNKNQRSLKDFIAKTYVIVKQK
ncbi:RDD family protein [Aureitalea marina]|uniref:RDD domain-containing protein n=1 Tax=Aureitalea marina TaxID=930804 RepID=A0A2S7KT47_9FLAO|nr:RDD family protein [Aureitalea marina]PQB05768.1 hypothetical protein BST85_13345 [Aureitalea marina]PQB05786.1 hypothetical protein BST85_13440 [Aureitalea marina]